MDFNEEQMERQIRYALLKVMVCPCCGTPVNCTDYGAETWGRMISRMVITDDTGDS